MTKNRIPQPTGKCFCGCNEPTKGGYFAQGHDKKAESMMTKLEYGSENSVVHRLVDKGYGPDGINLNNAFTLEQKKLETGVSEFYALQAVNEMAGKPGVAEAAVFVSPLNAPHGPTPTPAGAPQPIKTSVLEVPQRFRIVAQGFVKTLAPAEKKIVEARFPSATPMWLSNT